ncbi:MAG: copper-containing nitrite reductase, partial [Chloroflexota bacterium]
ARAANNDSDEPAEGNAASSGEVVEITVSAFDLGFDPDEIEVNAGDRVRLTMVNDGVMEHDLEIEGLTVEDLSIVEQPGNLSGRIKDLIDENHANNIAYLGANGGDSMTIEFTVAEAGEYEFLCVIPGHAEGGMTGTFIVAGESASDDDDDHETDAHAVTSETESSGEPYDADPLPNPEVAPPVGDREPQTVQYEVEIQEVVAKVDDGVAYEFWTFGGTVPGPMLRVREGDTVELTLKNPAESNVSHNIDLHAVTGPGGGAHDTTVAPGESATIRFLAKNPGVYVYHCAVPPIPHHISSGMYGLIVVEPEGGLPEVDREFYVMQGDLYLEGSRGEKGLRPFSMDKMLDERPDYVTFNGSVGAIADDRALTANVGETVRIFFGVGGPNLVSSFHVIGEIFDRVMPEGATEWSTNVQTTLVPAGGATVVEFGIDVPGTYVLVDHSLGRAGKGALGQIVVEGDENPDVYEVIRPAG